MSTYQTLKGLKIKYLTTDTSGDRIKEGELFYNSIAGKLKSYLAAGAWHSGANLLTSRSNGGGAGTTTAGLNIGGNIGPSDTQTTFTEEYDGSGFTVGGALPAARRSMAASGTQTAAIASGGFGPPTQDKAESFTYDGTSFTEIPSINTTRQGMDNNGAGTTTAALVCGGLVTGTGVIDDTEEYNGSAWSEQNDLNTARARGSNIGSQTAALFCGGSEPSVSAHSEEYNGTSWTEGNNLNTARKELGGAGTQTSATIAGGSTGSVSNVVEQYDGTSWTTIPATLGTARTSLTPTNAGTSSSYMVSGGNTGSIVGNSEEFTISLLATTGGAWSSGANYPTTIQDAAGAGPSTAAVLWGGYDGPAYDAETFEYDGTTWTESGDLNTARACYNVGTGSQTAALQASGYATSDHTENSEEYNGTAWTEGNNLNNPRYSATGGGIQTSALICGGNGDPGNSASAFNESYNGTSWSNETALPGTTAGGKQYSGTGETASLIIGFGSSKNDTLSYDGSSWTDLGHHLVEGKTTSAGGSQQGTTTAALIAGGFDPSPSIIAKSQQYNGTTWVTAASLATARRGGGASGTATDCLAVGGETPTQINTVEEFIGETTTQSAAKTIDFD